MSDTREAILDAIRNALVAANLGTVKRMAVSLHASERPAIVINDGDETARPTTKQAAAPNIIDLKPVVLLFAADSGQPGELLNGLRASVLSTLLLDATLPTITGVHGGIRYLGCQTNISRGETMEAEMALLFEISYVFNPADL